MRKLVIVRGPSGSGKSTVCNHLRLQGDYCVEWLEADMFFVSEADGTYQFDASQLGRAHAWCQDATRAAMMCEVPYVIVSNTSMAAWEMQPYLDLAAEYDYEVEIIRTPGPWDASVLFERNVHGVPLETLEKQINKYQPHENETEWTNMSVFNKHDR